MVECPGLSTWVSGFDSPYGRRIKYEDRVY